MEKLFAITWDGFGMKDAKRKKINLFFEGY